MMMMMKITHNNIEDIMAMVTMTTMKTGTMES